MSRSFTYFTHLKRISQLFLIHRGYTYRYAYLSNLHLHHDKNKQTMNYIEWFPFDFDKKTGLLNRTWGKVLEFWLVLEHVCILNGFRKMSIWRCILNLLLISWANKILIIPNKLSFQQTEGAATVCKSFVTGEENSFISPGISRWTMYNIRVFQVQTKIGYMRQHILTLNIDWRSLLELWRSLQTHLLPTAQETSSYTINNYFNNLFSI